MPSTKEYIDLRAHLPNAIYAECNSPNPVVTDGVEVRAEFDTFYDFNTDTIDSGDVAAALAAIGLAYSAGLFTADEPWVGLVGWDVSLNDAPTSQINKVFLRRSGMYTSNELIHWTLADPPRIAEETRTTMCYLNAGDTLRLSQIGTTITDGVLLTYAALAIVRLQ